MNIEYILRVNELDIHYTNETNGGGDHFLPEYAKVIKKWYGKVDTTLEWCAGPGFIGYGLLAAGLCNSVAFNEIFEPAIEMCKKTASKQSHPFCSTHCANVDLGKWFNGQYSIPSFEENSEDEITDNDIATIYPIFSIMDDHENLINLLTISISRDNKNMEYLEVLRRSYIQLKDYENAENIYQMILELENN